MAMTKFLSRHGNSLALVIDRGLLDLLEIDEETPLRVDTDGRILFVSRETGSAKREAVRRAARKSLRRYGSMYKRLADR